MTKDLWMTKALQKSSKRKKKNMANFLKPELSKTKISINNTKKNLKEFTTWIEYKIVSMT